MAILEQKDFTGVDFNTHPRALAPTKLQNAQNAWAPAPKIIGKRPGTIALVSLPAGTVRALKRFYTSAGNTYTVCAIEASDSRVRFYSVTDAGVVSTLTGGTTFTAGAVTMEVYQDVLYTQNGTDPMKSWTGTGAMANVAGWAAARRGRYMRIYNDRLAAGGGTTNPGRFYFSDVFDATTITGATQWESLGDRSNETITGVGLLGVQTDTQGLAAGILWTKQASLWLLQGSVTASGVVDQISGRVGCVAHQTIAHTPFGIVLLSNDNVFLVRGQGEPIAIGDAIQPRIREIPAARRASAVAVYHNGHYKLAFTPSGGTRNTVQYWLDLRRFNPAEPEWWGPMTNGTLYSFGAMEVLRTDDRPVTTLSADVSEQAIALTDNATPILVWLDQNTFDDQGTAIEYIVQGRDEDGGTLQIKKEFRKWGANLRNDPNETISGRVILDGGAYTHSRTLTLSQAGAQWNVDDWDVAIWGGTWFQAVADSLATPINASKGSLELTHSNATDVRIEAMQLQAKPTALEMEE